MKQFDFEKKTIEQENLGSLGGAMNGFDPFIIWFYNSDKTNSMQNTRIFNQGM